MVSGQILHYEILEKLGEGGMGEVYKAHDTKLDRFVALKFLPSQLTAKESEKARFIQEAKAASALNHPNICTIHDIEEHEGQLFIVMECVDGETLRGKHNLSVKQVIEAAAQAAEGLAAAHEKGIVHRDIKPENIMLMKNGVVKVMDFGLAKLNKAEEVSRLTKAGTTLGTVGYMSPEQVQGQDVDHRSDIFSLGVVLYELLAGESPFKGVHETAIMYEIVNVDPPPISTIKEGIDPELDKLISDCLEKDRDERLQSAKELAKNLRRIRRGSTGVRVSKAFQTGQFSSKETEVLTVEPENILTRIASHVSKNRISTSITALSITVVVLLIFLKIWQPSSSFTQAIHFSFDIPGQSGQLLHWQKILQVSPDGRTIAYTDYSGLKSIIYARDINHVMPSPIAGTEGGEAPVFINNNWLSFIIDGAMLRKVQVTGGVPDISNVHTAQGFSWGSAGELIYDEAWSSGLTYKNGWNGKEEDLTKVDPSKGEGAHLWPYVLPGNKAALFTIWSNEGTFDDSKIGVVDLKTKERKDLSYNGSDLQGTSPGFIQTSWGDYLLWSRGGDLYAAPFDLSGLKVIGTAVKILNGISVDAESGVADYSVTNANNGTIVYVPGKLDIDKDSLVWVDKNGNEQKALPESGPYLMPVISKEGSALIIIKGPVYSIGEINFKKNEVSSLFTSGDNNDPKITPDGSSFVFVSNFEDGKYNIYLSRLDGIGGVKKIVATEGGYPEISNLSPDGKYILFDQTTDTPKIMIKDITNDDPPKLLIKTDANTTSPEFSPDGKFIAYRSDEIGGKYKLFLRPFPINNEKIQVSINDGIFPQWSFDGSRLYYREGDKIMAARIQTKPELKVASRDVICTSLNLFGNGNAVQQDFAVAPGGRILLLKDAEDVSKPVTVNVIVNWFTELKNELVNQN